MSRIRILDEAAEEVDTADDELRSRARKWVDQALHVLDSRTGDRPGSAPSSTH